MNKASAMQYLRVCLGNESGDPGMTLYEVDDSGWVHRQVQLCAAGTRFAPEDILMCSPVNTEAMIEHPATEAIGEEEFELLWTELAGSRDFLARVPDPCSPWRGWLTVRGQSSAVYWLPQGGIMPGWTRVPGFTRLFVEGDALDARSVCAALFVEQPVQWQPAMLAAA